MSSKKNLHLKAKRLIIAWSFNIIGVICLLLVPVVGPPLPGPGGTILLILGLHLLAKNNPWAKKLKDQTVEKGLRLTYIIFPKNKKIQLAWDAIGLLGFITTILVWFNLGEKSFIIRGLLTCFLTAFCIILLYNRQRQEWIIFRITSLIKKKSDSKKK